MRGLVGKSHVGGNVIAVEELLQAAGFAAFDGGGTDAVDGRTVDGDVFNLRLYTDHGQFGQVAFGEVLVVERTEAQDNVAGVGFAFFGCGHGFGLKGRALGFGGLGGCAKGQQQGEEEEGVFHERFPLSWWRLPYAWLKKRHSSLSSCILATVRH